MANDERPRVIRFPFGLTGTSKGGSAWLAAVPGVLAVAAAFVPAAAWIRAVMVLALVGATWFLARRTGSVRAVAHGWVLLDDMGMVRIGADGADVCLAHWESPFGLTVLANPLRTRLVLAFTTSAQTRYVPVRLGDRAEALFRRAATVAEADFCTRDDAAMLESRDAEKIVLAVLERVPSALDRMVLSDTKGRSIVLDAKTLRLADRRIDLAAPLEWRPFAFHESAGPVASIYQATWIRQGEHEAVFVAPMPSDAGWADDLRAAGIGRFPKTVASDLSLMRVSPEPPPARELRFAVDRLFMLPLRRALQQAPHARTASLAQFRATSWGGVPASSRRG
ncbi:MAG: hypothetical protein WCI05_19200 [Myxococcales bacterium]